MRQSSSGIADDDLPPGSPLRQLAEQDGNA